jgi:hypothetical protein
VGSVGDERGDEVPPYSETRQIAAQPVTIFDNRAANATQA